MSIVLDRRCPFSQEAFLAHHNVEVVFDETDPRWPRSWKGEWGLSWKQGVMSSISLQPERAEAVAVASLFIEWWLTIRDQFDPGQLIRAAWFFYNPDEFWQARELFRNDVDSEPMFVFVEEQLSLFPADKQ